MQIPKVAVLQLTANENINDNLATVYAHIEKLFQNDSPKLLVLPENVFSFGFSAKAILDQQEVYGQGQVQETVSAWAKTFNCQIVIGSIYLFHDKNQVTKSSLVFNESGQCVARYDKLHLFDVVLANGERHLESEVIKAGDKVVVADSAIGRLGLSICYDLRFPELYQALSQKGAEILLVPAAFTKYTGAAHWLPLLQARAIENQCFVVAANQVGKHFNGRETFGHSVVISPWGEILVMNASEQGFITSAIDLTLIAAAKAQIPCRQHKKGVNFYE